MNTTHEVKRVAVIGAGPSGMTAALYAARAGFETTIFEKQAPGGQMVNTATIDNFPGHTNTPGFQLAKDMLDTLTSTSANIVYKEVTQISKTTDGFEITTSDQTQPFDYVIFASGISPRRLEVPEYDKFFGRGISTCVICDSSLVKGKPVVIVGGGNSAIEESIYISNIASDVVVINRDAQPIAEESIITAASKISNITIMNSKTIVNVNGQNSIESVTLDDGTVIPTTAVFTYIGWIPKTDLINFDIELNEVGFIKVDSNKQTSQKGMFAIGDITEKEFRQITTSIADGTLAALSLGK